MATAPADRAPTRTVQLPASSISALADLVAAGYGVAPALEALPRQSLNKKTVRALESEVADLRGGGPVAGALARLGLEITAASIRGSQSRLLDLEAALRADAAARSAAAEALRATQSRVQFFAVLVAGFALLALTVTLVLVPRMITEASANLPEGWELPTALERFEGVRNLWLALGAGILLVSVSLPLAYAGLLGRGRWLPFLQDLRLHLPFLRGHAIHGTTARLLEALAHEQAAGIPANQTVRRIQERESVPRLRDDLGLAAARLDAGDPWESCLRGTLLDTPILADLAALAGRGAQPSQGWHWAAVQNREMALKGLRRAIVTVAAIVLIPCFLYLLVLLYVSSATAIIAQVESVRHEIELLTQEVERIILSTP